MVSESVIAQPPQSHRPRNVNALHEGYCQVKSCRLASR